MVGTSEALNEKRDVLVIRGFHSETREELIISQRQKLHRFKILLAADIYL